MLQTNSADVQKSHLRYDTLLVMYMLSYRSLGGGMWGHGLNRAG